MCAKHLATVELFFPGLNLIFLPVKFDQQQSLHGKCYSGHNFLSLINVGSIQLLPGGKAADA